MDFMRAGSRDLFEKCIVTFSLIFLKMCNVYRTGDMKCKIDGRRLVLASGSICNLHELNSENLR
jgi:hypothetical protein